MAKNSSTIVLKKMAKWQLLSTLSVSVLLYAFFGNHAAFSAIAGGISVMLGGYAASLVANSLESKTEAGAILIGMLKAELVKILVVAFTLLLVFKFYKENLVPIALILGLSVSAILSGAAILSLEEKSKI